MRSLVALLTVLAAAALAAPAAALESTERIATQLARDPVYVDPSFDEVVTPQDRAGLRATIEAQDATVYVAIVPLRPGDRFDGDERAFLTALQARVGDTRAAYVVFAEDFPRALSADPELARRLSLATSLTIDQRVYDGPIADALTLLVELLSAPDLEARAERQSEQRRAGRTASGRGEDGGGVPLWLVLVGGAVALAGGAGLVVGRTGRRGVAPGAPPLLPERVFEHARRAHVDELRRNAREEVVKLSQAIEAVPTPSTGPALAAYERGVESAAAASALADRATLTVELAGALVLVDGAREALREAVDRADGRRHTAARPLCFFDPLHGRAAGSVRWTVRDVAACRTCAAAVKAGRDPEVLREDGTPWFERDGALAETGMGQFADLATRLARGDTP